MSLSAAELAQVARELNAALAGAFVRKAYAPRPRLCYLEVRDAWVCVSAEADVGRLSIATARAPGAPQPLQRALRDRVVGKRLSGVSANGRAVSLSFDGGAELRALVQPRGQLQLWFEGKVVASSPAGQVEVPLPAIVDKSRLPATGAARAAEALFLIAPLEQRLAKLERTMEKVRAEAARQPLAEEHRRIGELLSGNLSSLQPGAKSVRLMEYGDAGAVEREIALDPRRSPKDEVAWHFKEYKRLLRGCELAARRLAQLEEQRRHLAEEIAGPVRAVVEKPIVVARPWREYASHGLRIRVGKDARGNDALTFGEARPHDVWLHARGVPGSHVVVSLERKAELPQEVLLDAAHLALFHSQAKGEPRGEVAYTRVKNVRRVKGGAPGAVTYTQERTFVVRIEPERLERLNGSPGPSSTR